jgi:hypothetical protein
MNKINQSGASDYLSAEAGRALLMFGLIVLGTVNPTATADPQRAGQHVRNREVET